MLPFFFFPVILVLVYPHTSKAVLMPQKAALSFSLLLLIRDILTISAAWLGTWDDRPPAPLQYVDLDDNSYMIFRKQRHQVLGLVS